MDAMTQTIWDFMAGAYRQGLLDEAIALAGRAMPEDMDLGDAMGGMEEALVNADFSTFESLSEKFLPPLLKALSTNEALTGLKEAIALLGPAILEKGDPVTGEAKPGLETALKVGQGLLALRPLLMALLPEVTRLYSEQIEQFIRNQGGHIIGSSLNAAAKTINAHPETTTKVMADMFSTIDPQSLRQTVEIMTNGILDHSLPLAKWSAIALIKRAKRRVLRLRRG